ncbi:hypothetical protein FYJ38_00105 [Clostridium sp. WB02_MRS01]|uniref:hypothetical protein n=1 Tax=Clostridium sp. WB02_MRS01 TaxID=2605777 RepID=UPI0012B27ED3|nr:hypothetical protein [Clostridium sp. WB02_MRS01]MSS07040.1 hypothetical protein [Clostridium sp. WB02_MRS01]
MNANDLLESKELRERLVAKVEILDKVKKLLLIPGTELATVKQVADFYEVGEEAVKAILYRSRDELEEDGISPMTGKETKGFLESCNLQPSNFRGGFEVNGMRFSNRGNTLLSRRAILRIGMLLRESEIAKEVRTQLLNIEEKATPEIKTADITEEQTLALSVGMAYASGDPDAILIATTKMMNYKNRHIAKLEESKIALANGILEWEDRSRINFAVKKMAAFAKIPVSQAWNELYKQVKNKYHIDLPSRGKQPWVDHIKEEEWKNVIKAFSALCEYYEIEPSEMFHDLKIEV